MKLFICCIWSLGILFLSKGAAGQMPSFSMQVSNTDVTGACTNIGITFTNTSTVPTNQLKWDFGDNYTISNTSSISHTYSQSGNYIVKLTNTTTQQTYSKNITVYNNPTAGFSLSDSVACVGTNITFTSTSLPGSAAIKSYTWTFGDGNVLPLSTSSTTYAYNQGGVFSPILTVRDGNGCAGTSLANRQIKINGSEIQSAFLANGTDFYSCSNTINLQNTTSENGKSGITYLWNFGDNTTSTEKSPQAHTYAAPGVYTIILQANINGTSGCAPVYSKKVYIGTPAISINAANTICQKNTLPIAASSNIPGFINSAQDILWKIDNGGTVNSDGSGVVLNNAGTATLSASNRNGCPVTTTQNIEVWPVPAFTLAVTPSNYGLCLGTEVNGTVNITNGVGIQQYVWSPLGTDGAVHSTTTTNSYAYQYQTAGQFNYTVSATSTNGCSATQSTSVNINQECIDNGSGSTYNPIFSFASASCTNKNTITLTNKNPNKPVSSWTIDGSNYPVSNGQSLTITLAPKPKNATYSVSTYYQNGTADLNREITIIDEKASFDIVNNQNAGLYCANNQFTLSTANRINPGNISKYFWTIQDAQGTVVQTGSAANLTYSFPQTGNYTISLHIEDTRMPNPCTSDTSATITVKGLSGDFVADSTAFCYPTPTVTFNPSITLGGAALTRMVWTFGDGSSTDIDNPSSSNTVSHQYTAGSNTYQDFDVNLKATDQNGCFINIAKTQFVQVHNPKIGFSTQDTILCDPSGNKTIVINNTSDALNAKYTWTAGGQTQTTNGNQPFSLLFSNIQYPSDLNVALHLVDGIGCTKDTLANNYIHFRKPKAGFSIANLEALYTCPPFTLNIKNTSTDFGTSYWTINSDFNSIQKDSFYYTVLHPGSVSISLKAVLDACTSDTSENYTVKGPVAKLLTHDTIGCTPYTALLYVSNNDDIVSYQWDKGDNITYVASKTADSIRFTYNSAGTYSPSVTFIGKEGCSDKQQYPSPIIVQQSVDLKYTGNYTFCSNDTLLDLTVSAGQAAKYSWSQIPSTGYMSGTSGTTIGVRPVENTTYHVVAQSGNMCPSDSGDIFVRTAEASEVSFTPNVVTQPAGTVFTFTPKITNEDLGVNYYWTPDYRMDNQFLENPTIVADNDTTYRLSIKNENGCVSSDTVRVHVLCNTSKLLMANAFTPNGDGKNDKFYITGYGIKKVVHFIIIDRWGYKVFERNNVPANDPGEGWDGNINGRQAMPGTYIYRADIQCSEGSIIPLKGSVVLIR